jgi:hypothetical protein
MQPQVDEQRSFLVGGQRDVRTRQAIGATLGLAGGFVSAVVGALILALGAALRLFGFATHPHLETVGSVLLVSIIPLMIFGGHCLDKLDEHPN